MPLSEEIIKQIISEYGTPVFIYDVAGMKHSASLLNSSFKWSPVFRNFFAVKALPRLEILKALRQCGNGVECCSLPELLLAEQAGFYGSQIIYTCMFPLRTEVSKARSLSAIVNLDYTANLDLLLQEYAPKTLLFRLNPGGKIDGGQILGVPRDAKFGSTEEQVIDGIRRAQSLGIKELGLHGMFASNTLAIDFFLRSVKILLSLGAKIQREHGITITHFDLGGGIGIPYHDEDSSFDLSKFGEGARTILSRLAPKGASDLHIYMECGRYISGPHGIFVTRVLQVKRTYKTFVYVDGSATHYPRPGVYGGYNKVSVLGKPATALLECDVVGLLCDNMDNFCRNRMIPDISVGDLLVVHDAGAHAAAMSSDYNGRLRCREVIVLPDNSHVSVRQPQTIYDYLQEK